MSPLSVVRRSMFTRGPVRRALEVRGVLGGHRAPAVRTRLRAADGTRLAGSYLPGPPGTDLAVLLAHGFAANRRKPAYARLADALATRGPVLSLDLRGHGRSGGRCTWGQREALDVAAGVAWLQAVGHPRVVTLGLSMGATAVLYAAAQGAPVAAVIAVSGPAWIRDRAATPALERLETTWRRPLRRHLLRLVLGVDLVDPRDWQAPDHPVQSAGTLGVPLLVVHGQDDAYFPMGDAEALHAAAGPSAVLWREPAGFGHAEDGLRPDFIEVLGRAIVEVGCSGRFPARHEVR